MARGWESKSVESQQSDSDNSSPSVPDRKLSPGDIQKKAKHDRMVLDRTRVLGELECACNARFRAQLSSELAFLDGEIKKLE